MLKSYAKVRHAADSQDVVFWEDYFAAQSFDYLVRSFATDPLRPLFEEYCAGGARVLEGGCGLGNYLPCLEDLGARPIGLDFGVDMLKNVRRRHAPTPLIAGDVCALPFRDQTFDVYYSGGVMEHFEAGPSPGLSEAFRVLRRGGVFLVSVPYENPVRLALGRWRAEREGLLTAAVQAESAGVPPPDHSFFQYFYRAPEFRRHLIGHGFQVVREQPYSLWRGLTVLEPFRSIDRAYARRVRNGGAGPSAPQASRPPAGRHTPLKERLKYWMFAEDRSLPVFGTLLSAGCALAANMRMYVCRRP
jgi:SAM-dependent methyltransferase